MRYRLAGHSIGAVGGVPRACNARLTVFQKMAGYIHPPFQLRFCLLLQENVSPYTARSLPGVTYRRLGLLSIQQKATCEEESDASGRNLRRVLGQAANTDISGAIGGFQ